MENTLGMRYCQFCKDHSIDHHGKVKWLSFRSTSLAWLRYTDFGQQATWQQDPAFVQKTCIGNLLSVNCDDVEMESVKKWSWHGEHAGGGSRGTVSTFTGLFVSQQIIQKPLIIKWSTYLHISARLVSRFMLTQAPCNPGPRPRPGTDLLLIFKYKSCDPKLLLFSADNIRMLTPGHASVHPGYVGPDQHHYRGVGFLDKYFCLSMWSQCISKYTWYALCIAGCYTKLDMLDTDQDLVWAVSSDTASISRQTNHRAWPPHPSCHGLAGGWRGVGRLSAASLQFHRRPHQPLIIEINTKFPWLSLPRLNI